MSPLVSVLIPAYNAEATLAETVRSALASTYESIEVVIVDDGSTDSTRSIAKKLAEDRRVRLVTQKNRGLPGALNAGVAAASGEFVARLDADDLWHPTKLSRQVALALSDGAPGFIYTFYRYLSEDGRVLFDGPPQRFPARALRRSVYETLIGTGSSMLMRKRMLEDLGGFDETYQNSEDVLFQVKAAASHRIGFVPQYLVGYRLRSKSLSQNADAMREVWSRLRGQMIEEYPQVPPRAHDWAHARRSMSMAEGYARNGRFGAALNLLSSSMRSDPLWTLAFLAYRGGRRIKGRSSPPESAGLPFLDYDPEKALASEEALYGTEGRMMGLLHQYRIRRLTALDA